MNNIKDLFTNIDKCTLLGTIGCTLGVLYGILIKTIPTLYISIILLIYFAITYMRLKGKKTIIKVKTMKIIVSLTLLLAMITLPITLVRLFSYLHLLQIFFFILSFIWMICICGLLNNKIFLSSKLFLLIVCTCLVLAIITYNLISVIMINVTVPTNQFVIPYAYFYNYYELLREVKEDGQEDN